MNELFKISYIKANSSFFVWKQILQRYVSQLSGDELLEVVRLFSANATGSSISLDCDYTKLLRFFVKKPTTVDTKDTSTQKAQRNVQNNTTLQHIVKLLKEAVSHKATYVL